MPTMRRFIPLFLGSMLSLAALPARAQRLIATVPVGEYPTSVAVNPVTHKVYVANMCGGGGGPCDTGTVTVIDEATLTTTTVAVGYPGLVITPIAVNKTTNKIYVGNACGSSPNCSNGTVTVIDGATLATTTVLVGTKPSSIAVNEVTNQIFVANACSAGICDNNHPGTLTIIDGATLSTTSLGIEFSSYDTYPAVAVNPVTNKVFVTSPCGTDPTCYSPGAVTMVDPVTLANSTVPVGRYPQAVAVNSVTNKVYVGGMECPVTQIDGTTLATTVISTGGTPTSLAVNAVTNHVYAVLAEGGLADIDGATLISQWVQVGNTPGSLAVNATTNKIYVPSVDSEFVTAVNGVDRSYANFDVAGMPKYAGVDESENLVFATGLGNTEDEPFVAFVFDGTPPTAWQFVPVTPCRVVDTRNPDGMFGGPPIQGQTFRSFPLPQGGCNIPPAASAYALNVTVVPHGTLGYLTIWPYGQPQPVVSTLNSLDGRIKANAAIVAAGVDAAVSVYVTNTTDVVLDINGYFVPLPNPDALAFYPLTPCRVADTRNPNGPLGGPYLQGGQQRDFPVLQAGSCNIPDTAVAYSMNFTTVPKSTLAYLTVWPSGQPQPLVSTLNDATGTIVANAAIVPAGANGDIDTYVTNDTDLVIDINGYFAPSGQGGLSLYAPPVCRVVDSALGGGPFSGKAYVPVLSGGCGALSSSQAFVFNATVMPVTQLSYLTLWPDSEPQPLVSTLNAADGAITSNMAIVPNVDGMVDAFAPNFTNLIVDISAYFAP